MKIDQSTIAMQSQHTSVAFRFQQSAVRAWVGERRPDFDGQRAPSVPGPGVRLLMSARASVPPPPEAAAVVQEPSAIASDTEAWRQDPRLRLLMDMVEALTGRSVKVFDARELQVDARAVSPVSPAGNAGRAPAAATTAGWGLEVDTLETVAEFEHTRVNAQGVVNTADGKQISFTLQLEMSRAFVQTSRTSVRAGDAVRKDPLVINFGGTAAELADTQFAFDLDADGQTEHIAFVAGGSGFLALDKNADGHINNGTELFGSLSGDGFADLAQHDQDGNQWIDEGDAVYSQLRVWQRDASGQDRLTSLAQNGVGALYLGRVASPFSVNTATNQSLGLVRSTGVFLYESGQVGSLQQVDL